MRLEEWLPTTEPGLQAGSASFFMGDAHEKPKVRCADFGPRLCFQTPTRALTHGLDKPRQRAVLQFRSQSPFRARDLPDALAATRHLRKLAVTMVTVGECRVPAQLLAGNLQVSKFETKQQLVDKP